MTNPSISPELYYTVLVALFTGVMWIPIVINRLLEGGIWPALQNPQPDTRAKAAWAWRLANAHRNAIENLVVFAPLAIAVHVLGMGTAQTATAAATFFFARVAHAVIYTAGIPLLRTIAFTVGFVCQVYLAARVPGWL